MLLATKTAGQLIPTGTTLPHAKRCDFSLAEMWNRTLALDVECPRAPAQCSVGCGVVHDGSDYLDTGEKYDPATNTWTPIASMSGPRFAPAAVAL